MFKYLIYLALVGLVFGSGYPDPALGIPSSRNFETGYGNLFILSIFSNYLYFLKQTPPLR